LAIATTKLPQPWIPAKITDHFAPLVGQEPPNLYVAAGRDHVLADASQLLLNILGVLDLNHQLAGAGSLGLTVR